MGDDIRRNKLQQEEDLKRVEKSLATKTNELSESMTSSAKKTNSAIEDLEKKFNGKVETLTQQLSAAVTNQEKKIQEAEDRIKADLKARYVDPLLLNVKNAQGEIASLKKKTLTYCRQ